MASACEPAEGDDASAEAYRRWLAKGFVRQINGHSFLEEMLLDWMRHVRQRIAGWRAKERRIGSKI